MFPQNLFWNVDRIAVFGRRAARYIVPLLNDPDPNVRKGLVQVLKRISAKSTRVPLTRVMLGDPDPGVRAAAAEALGRLGDRRASRALTRALGDADPEVRRQAAFALGQVRAKRVGKHILHVLESDPYDSVRAAAAWPSEMWMRRGRWNPSSGLLGAETPS